MLIDEAMNLLDRYFSNLELCGQVEAWQCIREELVDGQKPTTNSASTKLPTLAEICKELGVDDQGNGIDMHVVHIVKKVLAIVDRQLQA